MSLLLILILEVEGYLPKNRMAIIVDNKFSRRWTHGGTAPSTVLQAAKTDNTEKFKRALIASIVGVSTSFSSPTIAIESSSSSIDSITAKERDVTDIKEKNNNKVFNEVWKIVNDNYVDETFNNNDWGAVRRKYEENLENGADETAVTQKALSLLGDKYTRLLDKKFFESLWEYDAIGVGLLFQSDPGKNMVIASPPISGSSGAAANIKKGDLVYAINGVSTEKMTAMQVLDMMSNDDSEYMKLEYSTPTLDGGDNGSGTNFKEEPEQPHKIATLKRSKQKATNPVSSFVEKLINGKTVGYASLAEFNSEAVPRLREAIVSFEKAGVDYIVLDLRGNTGGGFQFALNIGGMFMDNKNMVTTVGRNNEKSSFASSYPEGVISSKPLVLLTDGLSASASEVLAGGLHDNCRAIVAGSKSFGKGKIQAVFGLADGEGLTMTVAQYVTPKGTIIQSRGIQPDIPLSVSNPYVNLLFGSGAKSSKPDLNAIDFAKASELVNACKAETSL